MGLFNLFKPAPTVLVVDVVALNESLGMKGNVAPRNQLQTFRRLARFAQREKTNVIAVSSGTPLNKAPAGKRFEGIVILYSKSMEDHPAFLVKTARSNGTGAILVSGSDHAEKLLGRSAGKMRISTFRKAFDAGADPSSSERGSGGSRGNNNRPPRRNRQKQAPSEPRQERAPKQMSDTDAINELIDLVD